MISVADNFSLLSQKPLDARLKYSTISAMVNTADSSLYDGCLAYVTDTKKYYSYDNHNTVDETLGKWREYAPNYEVLSNIPKINNVTLTGNKVSKDLKLQGAIKEFTGAGSQSIDNAIYASAGETVNYYFKWLAGNAFDPLPGFPNPTGTQYPMVDTFYIASLTMDPSETYIDYTCYAFYTRNSVDYVRLYAKRAYKNDTTWTYPDWIELTKPDNDISHYCTSSTAASTAAKTATLSNNRISPSLSAGLKVRVNFSNTNTATTPTLKVGSLTAKNIKVINDKGNIVTPTTFWKAGEIVEFIYDGTQWLMQPTFSMSGSNYEAGDGIDITDNTISADIMPTADMSEIITPLPGATPRWMNYSTEEQAVGTWIDGKTIYQRTITGTTSSSSETYYSVALGVSIDTAFVVSCVIKNASNTWMYVDKSDASNKTVSITSNNHATSPNKFAITTNQVSRPFIATIQYTKV